MSQLGHPEVLQQFQRGVGLNFAEVQIEAVELVRHPAFDSEQRDQLDCSVVDLVVLDGQCFKPA